MDSAHPMKYLLQCIFVSETESVSLIEVKGEYNFLNFNFINLNQKWNLSSNINNQSKTLSMSTRSCWKSMRVAYKSRTDSTGSTAKFNYDCIDCNQYSFHCMFDNWYQTVRYSTSKTIKIWSQRKI